jgi:IS30 family transposase
MKSGKTRSRLTYKDRKQIEKMYKKGERISKIADVLGFHRATIYLELKRGGTPYRADIAQRNIYP